MTYLPWMKNMESDGISIILLFVLIKVVVENKRVTHAGESKLEFLKYTILRKL